MDTQPCSHSRQKAREFSIPGVTEDEADQDIYCAVPDCPAGTGQFDCLAVSAEYLHGEGSSRAQTERHKIVSIRRHQAGDGWMWVLCVPPSPWEAFTAVGASAGAGR